MLDILLKAFVYLIAIYPFFAFIFRQIIDVRPNFFMSIIYFFLTIFILIKKKVKLPKYLMYYLFFAIYTVISDFQNGALNNSELITGMFGLPSLLEYIIKNRIIASFMVIFIIENLNMIGFNIERLSKTIKYIIYIATFVIIIQIFLPEFFLSPREYDLAIYRVGDFRRFSIFSWINTDEAGFTYPALVSIIMSYYYMRKDYFKINLLTFYAIIYSFLTKSRYVILSVLLVFLQYFNYRKVKFLTLARYVLVFVIILTLSYSLLSLMGLPVNEIISERILESNRGSFEETAAYTRVYAFKLFGTFFPENPIFGTGGIMEYDLMKLKGNRTSQIHVGWLSLLYYYGIFGGMFYILFAYQLMKKIYQTAKRTNYWGTFYAFITYFVSIMGTAVSFHLNFIGFIMAIFYNKYFEDNYLNNQYLQGNYER